MAETAEDFDTFTSTLLDKVNSRRTEDMDTEAFSEAEERFRQNAEHVRSSHAGFGGGDSEYDYDEYKHKGLIWRFAACNSGRRFIDVTRA